MPNRVDIALEKLAEKYDGIDNFHAEWGARTEEATKAWNSDHFTIGRVLRSHLYVEYYLNKYLKTKYTISAKQLMSFSCYEKIEFIKKKNDEMRELVPSISRLNRIRNKMSHDLDYTLCEKDSKYFKSREFFKNYYFLLIATIDENDSADIYELYSQFIVHRIGEILNPKQELLDNVMKALSKDMVDIYYDRV